MIELNYSTLQASNPSQEHSFESYTQAPGSLPVDATSMSLPPDLASLLASTAAQVQNAQFQTSGEGLAVQMHMPLMASSVPTPGVYPLIPPNMPPGMLPTGGLPPSHIQPPMHMQGMPPMHMMQMAGSMPPPYPPSMVPVSVDGKMFLSIYYDR